MSFDKQKKAIAAAMPFCDAMKATLEFMESAGSFDKKKADMEAEIDGLADRIQHGREMAEAEADKAKELKDKNVELKEKGEAAAREIVDKAVAERKEILDEAKEEAAKEKEYHKKLKADISKAEKRVKDLANEEAELNAKIGKAKDKIAELIG